MLVNKMGDMTPFDRKRKPRRQNLLLLPLVWAGAWLATRKNHLKIERVGMEGIKPPYLVYATHQGFSDYYIAPLALFPHRAAYISDVEGFAAFGEGLYRAVGCLGKRRYTADPALVRNLYYVTHILGESAVIFPEARHAIVGTPSRLPVSVGKLAKFLNIPVVTLTGKGSYLAGPFWDEKHPRQVPIQARLEKLLGREELANLSAEEITARVQARFDYDEHRWQQEQRLAITDEKRAEGLHLPLYQCPDCGTEYEMESRGCRLQCKVCGASWELTEYGALRALRGTSRFGHIPDWYEWERANTVQELAEERYQISTVVQVEALPNSKGFVLLGEGCLTQNSEGFTLSFSERGERRTLLFPSRRMFSVQIEYDYRGKGPCVVLSTLDCSWYAYPTSPKCSVTKMMFAAEALYQRALGNIMSFA